MADRKRSSKYLQYIRKQEDEIYLIVMEVIKFLNVSMCRF